MSHKGQNISADHATFRSKYPVEFISNEDIASEFAWEFHNSLARFRFLVWGWKAGKTYAGAREFGRGVLGQPCSLNWIVAPTYLVLQSAERAFLKVLTENDIWHTHNRVSHEITLKDGQVIQGKSAETPRYLLGPNVDTVWCDECFFKDEAWHNVRSRVVATEGEIICTTTPDGRDWLWRECQNSGMPADAPYGEFEQGDYFVSHRPTWDFDWVPHSEIEAAKTTMPRDLFEQNYGAMFISDAACVFNRIEDMFTREPPPDKKKDDGPNVMGLDLAKYQDFTVPIIGDSRGHVRHIDRWNKIEWTIQRARIIQLCEEWNCVVVIDASQAGSVIVEDLRAAGIEVLAVELNSPENKRALIQALQIAIERVQLKVPHPNCSWAPKAVAQLHKELRWMEQSLTRGGRISFSAPRGLHDDCVISLALYNWGRVHGYAGGPPAADGMGDEKNWGEKRKTILQNNETGNIVLRQPPVFGNIFGRRKSLTGQESMGGRFWT